jgi:cell division protein FtsL
MGRSRSSGVLRFALACALVLAGMALVIRRQSRALELMRAVEKARTERAATEAQRAELLQHIDWLESRARVAQVVERRGMRLPTGEEIVILPDGSADPDAPTRVPALVLR